MKKALHWFVRWLSQMGLPGKVLTGICVTLVIYFLTRVSAFVQKAFLLWVNRQGANQIQYFILIGLLLIVIALLLAIVYKLYHLEESPENELEPIILFSKIIIFRKIKRGLRSMELVKSFALSPKIGVMHEAEIFDTKLTLYYCIYKQKNGDSGSILRDGVEEITSEARYLEGVHRYSFYSDELPFKILERIISVSGKPSNDRIVILLTGSYGKDLKRFRCKHVYSSRDIVIADDTPKVIEYTIQDGQLIQKPDWDRLHLCVELENSEFDARVKELEMLVKARSVPSSIP